MRKFKPPRGIEHIPWLYDFAMGMFDRLGLRHWRRELLRNVSGEVLEIGCGTGRNLPRYPPDAHVVACDPDLQALKRAKGRGPGVLLVAARAEALPFREHVFDAAVSSLVFCSVEDPVRSLEEVKRVLLPGGELRMLEHVRARSPFWARFQDGLQPSWTKLTGGCRPNRDTEAVVREAGYRPSGTRKAKGLLRLFTVLSPGEKVSKLLPGRAGSQDRT